MSLSSSSTTENAALSSGERSLLVAVLQRALFDYFGNRSIEKQSAAEWLFGEDNLTEAFSFQWVCSQLDLDPEMILKSIQAMKPRKGLTTQQWWGQQRLPSANLN